MENITRPQKVPALDLSSRPGGPVPCPNCHYSFSGREDRWTSPARYVGQDKYVCHTVWQKVWVSCKQCRKKIPEQEYPAHELQCRPPGIIEVVQLSDDDGAQEMGPPGNAVRSKEKDLADLMFANWERVVRLPDPDSYSQRMLEVLTLSAVRGGTRKVGFTLSELVPSAEGSSAQEPRYPPALSELVKNCSCLLEAQRVKETYGCLLRWLRSFLPGWQARNRVPPADRLRHNRALDRLHEESESAELQLTPEGLVEIRGPQAEGCIFRYFSSPDRNEALAATCRLTSFRTRGVLKLRDGTDLLEPANLRNLLLGELFLRRGVSREAVLGCKVSEFLKKEASCGQHEGGGHRNPASETGSCWAVGPPTAGNFLFADGRLVRALESYVSHVRPALLSGSSRRQEDGPLFPTRGGQRLSTLVPSMHLFFKLAGGRPKEMSVTPANVEELRDVLVPE